MCRINLMLPLGFDGIYKNPKIGISESGAAYIFLQLKDYDCRDLFCVPELNAVHISSMLVHFSGII